MARGRFLSRSLANCRQFRELTDDSARLLFVMAIPHLDRDGRLHGDPLRFRSAVCPMLDKSELEISTALLEMIRVELVIAYEDDRGQVALDFPGFRRQQPGKAWYEKEAPTAFGAPPEQQGDIPELLLRWSGPHPDPIRTPSGVEPRNSAEPGKSGAGQDQVRVSQGKERKGKESETRARVGQDCGSDEGDKILARLQKYPALDCAANVNMALVLLGIMTSKAVPFEDVLAGIDDAGGEAGAAAAVGTPMTTTDIGTMLRRYCRRPKRDPEDDDENEATRRYKDINRPAPLPPPDSIPKRPHVPMSPRLKRAMAPLLGKLQKQ